MGPDDEFVRAEDCPGRWAHRGNHPQRVRPSGFCHGSVSVVWFVSARPPGSRTEPGYRPSANSRDVLERSTGWLPVRRSLGSGTDEGLAMSVDSHAVTALGYDTEAALVEPDD